MMELQANESITRIKTKVSKWFETVDLLEIVYLVLFVAFVMKKYLESTALEYEFPVWYDTAVRGGIHAYILVRIYEQAVVKKAMTWKEAALMAVMIFTGEMVTLYTGEIIISDTLLFIIGAKGVDFKKICFVYLCVAVSIQVVALYLVNAGYVPDYVYGNGGEIRHSLGICYPTDFAAHILFIMLAYVCIRGKRLTFVELSILAVLSIQTYRYTNAKNNLICMIILLVLLVLYKFAYDFHLHVERHRIMQVVTYCIIPILITCILVMIFYDSSNKLWNKWDSIFTARLSLSHKGFETYGIKLFGQNVAEIGGGFGGHQWLGEYFFLDSSYIRVLLKYGAVLLIIVCCIIVYSFKRTQKYHTGYITICLFVMIIYGIVEHHMFELAYNPLCLFLFAGICNRRREDAI